MLFAHDEFLSPAKQPTKLSAGLFSMPFRVSIFTIFILGASVSGYLAFRTKPVVQASVAVTFDKKSHDFGKLGQGEVVSTEFTLTNNFPYAIEFRGMLTGCSCSTSNIAPSRLEPGEKAIVTVKWDIGLKRGSIQDDLWVTHTTSNDSILGRLRLRIQAEVEPDLLLAPGELQFRAGQSDSKSVVVSAGRHGNFKILDAYANSSSFRISFEKTGSTVRVDYVPGAGDIDLSVRPSLTIVTDAPHEAKLSIPLLIQGLAAPQVMGVGE